MKFATVALILASATGLAAGADDRWHNRKLNERQAVGANPHATEEETYQAVLDYDLKRAAMLQEKLDHHRRRLEDHSSGRRLLEDADHQRTLRQITVFSRQLERLDAEGHKEKMEKVQEAREMFHNMHRSDYIDYSKTGL